ncbi:hypothetical protein BDM02DRAFT_3109741 [Thelephora ganbajun]|uniref:Uncharacterized protein n=1 Tax=Thelephora ganbajun TaxID=370292 RepID=A0ACB6ZR73_THEGA|nr:hypothetical protein BDM02DRAFT_3109741 [Thelephora ganbajun]
MHLRKDPNFIPLPNIEEGDDVEVKRWIKAGKALRDSIKKKLRDGTPWGFDLLEPIHL